MPARRPAPPARTLAGYHVGYHERQDAASYLGSGGADALRFGWELEIEFPRRPRTYDGFRSVIARINAVVPPGYLWFETDGSLSNGIEIISAAATARYHFDHEAEIRAMFAILRDEGARVTSRAGIHVHVTRAALGSTAAEIEATQAKILYLGERYWDAITPLARRGDVGFSARLYTDTPEKCADKVAGYKSHSDWYNMSGGRTDEVRRSKTTTDTRVFLGWLGFVVQLVTVCQNTSLVKIARSKSLRGALECNVARTGSRKPRHMQALDWLLRQSHM
jgi:hypothetical protein